MSFERVHNYIIRAKKRLTFVCVQNGRARCMPAEGEKAARIQRDFLRGTGRAVPVGVYNDAIAELDLLHDLAHAGVET